jgi:hypothetical protein
LLHSCVHALRFSRLHGEESKSEATAGAFSALNWLKLSDPVAEAASSQQVQEDALYVMGVAGLASKKLLHKHQIPIDSSKELKSAGAAPLTVEAVQDEGPIEAMICKHGIASSARNILSRIGNARRSLHQFQGRKLKQIGSAALKAPVFVTKKLVDMGGGKQNIKYTLALTVALTFVLVRPAAQFIANEGLNMTVGA